MLQTLVDQTISPSAGYRVKIEGTEVLSEELNARLKSGTVEVALVPLALRGMVFELARSRKAVSLEDLGLDITHLTGTFGDYSLSLGEFEGEHYGMPTSLSLKSMIWYRKDQFEAAGYKVPATWRELLTLSDRIVAAGGTPWCIGFGSGGASGWPGTDWLEDIMLRTAGPRRYQEWADHEISFDHPSVVHAGKLFGQILFRDHYVRGGPRGAAAISFQEAPLPMFDDPPGCWLHHQASFIASFFPKDAQLGVNVDWFPFPAIARDGAVFSGEIAVAFKADANTRDFLTRFSSREVQCAQGNDPANSRISPNLAVGPGCYADPHVARAARILIEALAADRARFDASDMMPPEVGIGSFWQGMIEYAQRGPDSLLSVLGAIERSWPATR